MKNNTYNEREVALRIVMEVLEHGAYLNRTEEASFRREPGLLRQSRAFIHRLASGTVERKLTLDRILNTYSKVKVKKMKPAVRNILRTGVYQLYYMDQVPDHVAVNEAVKCSESGDIILLSPTTSSFDQYSCFEERGEHFKRIVNSL